MNFYGSTISFPFRVDQRGAVVTTSDPDQIIEEAIQDIVETRRGERVMEPDYGIPDFIFGVQNATFQVRIADALEQQIKRYVPLVASVTAKAQTDEDGRAEVFVTYQRVDQFNAPKNLVFPVWQYQGVAQ